MLFSTRTNKDFTEIELDFNLKMRMFKYSISECVALDITRHAGPATR